MNVILDRKVIGRQVCYLERSIMSDNIICHTRTITGYMVEKDGDDIIARVRLDNGKWEKASRLFYPEEETLARRKFEEKFIGK